MALLREHRRRSSSSTHPFDRFAAGNWYRNMRELEGTLGLGAQIADIERIRHLLGMERLNLVGHSFGGFLAALHAVPGTGHFFDTDGPELRERVAAFLGRPSGGS